MEVALQWLVPILAEAHLTGERSAVPLAQALVAKRSATATAMPETMEISDAAKSGDGTTQNVGIKVGASFQCVECRQKFDSEKAKQLHWKFIHDPNRHQED